MLKRLAISLLFFTSFYAVTDMSQDRPITSEIVTPFELYFEPQNKPRPYCSRFCRTRKNRWAACNAKNLKIAPEK